jgi:CubicO group peptidase (beta-lactamase class C family)
MMRMDFRLLRLLAPCALFIFARSATADALDQYIREEMTNQRLPGVALAVIRNDKPIAVRAYGLANIETSAAVTKDTAFRLASLSKQMLASGMMLLVAEGKVSLDDPVSKYLQDPPPSWTAITVRQVLSHTSGLANEAPGFDPYRAQTPAERIRRARDLPLLSKPGEKYAYSNLGYDVVVEILERASGKPVLQFMSERVFAPLGMRDTRGTDLIAIVPNRANGYIYRDNTMRNAPPLMAPRSSGLFLSTLADLIKWDAALTAGKIITREMQRDLWTAVTLPDGTSTHYGFGWWVDEYKGHRRIRHGGSNPGFRTEYTRFVDDGISVIVLVNCDSARPDAIAAEVAGLYVPELATPRKTVHLTARELAPLAGRYQVSPTDIVTIGVDEPGLSIQSEAGGGQWRLVAADASTFFISRDESYVFSKENGTITQFVIRYGDTETVAKRLP